jgi:hypothetical protein
VEPTAIVLVEAPDGVVTVVVEDGSTASVLEGVGAVIAVVVGANVDAVASVVVGEACALIALIALRRTVAAVTPRCPRAVP